MSVRNKILRGYLNCEQNSAGKRKFKAEFDLRERLYERINIHDKLNSAGI